MKSLEELQKQCHNASVDGGWWEAPADVIAANVSWGEFLGRVTPVKLALVHSEVSEALEGFRKDKMDDHLPHRKSGEVELADAVIRILDLADAHNYDLAAAIEEKLAYNKTRADHTATARAGTHGKKF